jgi:hypothetical protein
VERGSSNCFNSFTTPQSGKTVETVASDRCFADTQLKLGVNEKLYRIRCYRSLV